MADANSNRPTNHAKDETGNVYGKLTVLSFAEVRGKCAHWLCRCECGVEKVVSGANLRKATGTRSCGQCFATTADKMSPWAKDERGNVYGKLTVIEAAGHKRGQVLWLCQCECGNTTTVLGSDLRKKGTVSCGCKRACARGLCKTTEYTSWHEMKARCYNPKKPYYHLYGGRDVPITICDRWLNSFANFLDDMGAKPFPEATIERIDVNGNYEPANCKWASPLEQGANTRKNVLLTLNGETMHIRAWARKLGLRHCVIRYRLKQGWPIEKVLTSERFPSPPPHNKRTTS